MSARMGRGLGEAQVVETLERLSVAELRIWCEAGWVAPARGEAGPAFDEVDLARIRLVCAASRRSRPRGRAHPGVPVAGRPALWRAPRAEGGLAAVERQPAEMVERVRAEYRVRSDDG